MKYHFITFATESHYDYAVNLAKSSIEKGGFDTYKIYKPGDIDDMFRKKNSHILNQLRGAGYWIWKIYFIYKHILEIDNNDVICYCDSMFLFTGGKKISEVYNENINHISKIILTKNKPNEPSYYEKTYSKGDAFLFMNCIDNKFFDTEQVWGGVIIINKNFLALQIIASWFAYIQDERIVTDSITKYYSNLIEFKENRHDQTVISLIAKKYEIPFISFPNNFLHNLRV